MNLTATGEMQRVRSNNELGYFFSLNFITSSSAEPVPERDFHCIIDIR